jgi:hypothetical protein
MDELWCKVTIGFIPLGERLHAGTTLVVALCSNGAPVEALKLARTNLVALPR